MTAMRTPQKAKVVNHTGDESAIQMRQRMVVTPEMIHAAKSVDPTKAKRATHADFQRAISNIKTKVR